MIIASAIEQSRALTLYVHLRSSRWSDEDSDNVATTNYLDREISTHSRRVQITKLEGRTL